MSRPPNPRAAEQDRLVLGMIERAAKRGDLCPSNDEIATAIRGQSKSAGANVVARLERRNLIRVESYHNARQVVIVASGLATRRPASRVAHWRRGRSANIAAAPEIDAAPIADVGPITVEEAAYIRFAYSREGEAFLANFLERPIATLRVIAGAGA